MHFKDIEALRVQWAAEFEALCTKHKRPVYVANLLAMSAVKGPREICPCCGTRDADLEDGGCGLGWSPNYNQRVHEVLRVTGMLPRVRRAVKQDLGKNKIFAEDKFAVPLLDHFLKAKPSKEWVE
jgi:hypothetical protein